ncbi:hypothetical protein EZV77_19110 [Burkholderia thailandensis]|nr:hypothetical protein [Burkholderia thailandensis]MDD1489536.1 hypothetical protein [Burkholderia thailandensis]MDD1495876.1 hypothetical protein [Burkholderia thailandensis]PJO68893.1 hypothetical protein CWD92_29870 [Burkholderia thailandensis]TBW60326.1 hypothetical protein EZV77_19110 [Burkholderia thailandensis]
MARALCADRIDEGLTPRRAREPGDSCRSGTRRQRRGTGRRPRRFVLASLRVAVRRAADEGRHCARDATPQRARMRGRAPCLRSAPDVCRYSDTRRRRSSCRPFERM